MSAEDVWGKIDGLDMDKGKKLFGGDGESYFQVLRSYALTTRPLLDRMKAVTADTLSEYVVVAHGIKGSSQAICAEALARGAAALEKAAKEGNYGFIKNNNGVFIEAAGKLINALDEMLLKIASGAPKPVKDTPSGELLTKLSSACRNYSMDGVDAVMAEIEAYQYDRDTGLSGWLRQNVDEMNFPRIVEKISGLCKI